MVDLNRYARFDGLDLTEVEPGIVRIEQLMDRVEVSHGHLGRVWPELDADPEVRVVIAGGSPNHYGAESLAFMERITQEWDLRMAVMREAHDLVYNVVNFTKPVVSTIPGPMLALALLADVSVAGRSADVTESHVPMGIVAGDHAVMIWPLLCGMAKAKYHILTGAPLTGEEAERIGLVSLCTDDDQVDATALEVARTLAAAPQRALRWTKRALNNWLLAAGPSFDAGLALEFMNFGGPDIQEGVAALKEGRAPAYKEAY